MKSKQRVPKWELDDAECDPRLPSPVFTDDPDDKMLKMYGTFPVLIPKRLGSRLQTPMIQFAGPDGNSIVHCGYGFYVEVIDGRVTCKHCGTTVLWSPQQVICANPDHNDPGGCGNKDCWKFRRGSSTENIGQ